MLSLKLTKGKTSNKSVERRKFHSSVDNIINDMIFYYSLHANAIQRYVSKSFNDKNKRRKTSAFYGKQCFEN
jgi:hypothetical protein